MSATEENGTIEGTAVELYPEPAQPTLFRTNDPAEVIKRATEVADALKGVLDKQGLTSRIQGRDYVQVEGWTTCGAMLGVVPVVEWTRPLANGWEARVAARTLDGRVIGGAEASCTRDETKWRNADEYALRGMAQTRATSRALRGPLGFIVTLAGYAATPAEEMGDVQRAQPSRPAPQTTAQTAQRSERPPTAGQKAAINARCAAAGLKGEEVEAIVNWIGAVAHLDRLPSKLASKLISTLGEDGSGARTILAEISAKAEQGDERATKVVARYFEVTPHA